MSQSRPDRGVVTRVALRGEDGSLAESGTYVEGKAADIYYEITIENRYGSPRVYRWVQPSHQRISDVFALRSARVSDEVDVKWSGNEPRWRIYEGLIAPDECPGSEGSP